MTFSFILIFALTVFVASIIPGPSMLLALTHGMCYGVKRTLASAMGNVSVTLIQALISIAGLGAVLVTSETAFQIVKWCGAAYLLYIGLSMLFSSAPSPLADNSDEKLQGISLSKMFLQSALTTAGNPKAIIFFSAVFPQFIKPDEFFLLQSVVLVVVCCVIAFACFMIYALGGQKVVSLFSSTRAGKYIQRTMGVTFIGSGVALAMSKR
ncbi:LysE family translocator [Vibrio salinus]|uniref:LysE family translocator n=1 Tax=Vibrio salinus TaxID=2899784 RepID=UPI001E417FAF|nr:LysE family translocator [Vibrio salinus]MCE0495544.1 LysE family translocator [Vibrio salinus]